MDRIHQFFLAAPADPVDGRLRPNQEIGLGMELDVDKADSDDVVFA